jgi:hypothetical protein
VCVDFQLGAVVFFANGRRERQQKRQRTRPSFSNISQGCDRNFSFKKGWRLLFLFKRMQAAATARGYGTLWSVSSGVILSGEYKVTRRIGLLGRKREPSEHISLLLPLNSHLNLNTF